MISLIVAYDMNNCIGLNNTIPWRMKSDMKRVKELTTNQTILMGRNTLESIGKALPNRINRVLTKKPDSLADYKNIEVFEDIDKALENIETEKIFIFGGSNIYSQLIDRCDEMFITEINTTIAGDAYFPSFNKENWEIVEDSSFEKDEYNEFDYRFLHYIRKGTR